MPRKKQTTKQKGNNLSQHERMKLMRQRVQDETIQAIQSLHYRTDSGKRVKLNEIELETNVSNIKLYTDTTNLHKERLAKQDKPIITIDEEDCLIKALQLKQDGFNPVVLNMASIYRPGGGFTSGSGTQEENIFRRTNLFQYLLPKKNEWYPLPIHGGIYCPNAVVIRSSEAENYDWLEKYETISFITVAALCRPKLTKKVTQDLQHTWIWSPKDEQTMYEKIRAILIIGLDQGHDAIVLSAFGCGAYDNPATEVARLFKEILLDYEFNGIKENSPLTYKRISFAIIEDENSKGKYNPLGNLIPFQQGLASITQ